MNRKKPFVSVLLAIFSLLGLWRFSQDVRTINVLGLVASGVIAGIIIAFYIIMPKMKREPW
jgi:threonine/homoserine efflux transporter RhtA